MFTKYFNEFRSIYLNKTNRGHKFAFWNSMCDTCDVNLGHFDTGIRIEFDELITLIIVNAIEYLYLGKYKPQYADSTLDVLDTAAIVWNRYSDECEKRFSIIKNFCDNSSPKEGIVVLDKAIEMSARYDKLVLFI